MYQKSTYAVYRTGVQYIKYLSNTLRHFGVIAFTHFFSSYLSLVLSFLWVVRFTSLAFVYISSYTKFTYLIQKPILKVSGNRILRSLLLLRAENGNIYRQSRSLIDMISGFNLTKPLSVDEMKIRFHCNLNMTRRGENPFSFHVYKNYLHNVVTLI